MGLTIELEFWNLIWKSHVWFLGFGYGGGQFFYEKILKWKKLDVAPYLEFEVYSSNPYQYIYYLQVRISNFSGTPFFLITDHNVLEISKFLLLHALYPSHKIKYFWVLFSTKYMFSIGFDKFSNLEWIAVFQLQGQMWRMCHKHNHTHQRTPQNFPILMETLCKNVTTPKNSVVVVVFVVIFCCLTTD